jgi:hypothetical protein
MFVWTSKHEGFFIAPWDASRDSLERKNLLIDGRLQEATILCAQALILIHVYRRNRPGNGHVRKQQRPPMMLGLDKIIVVL